MLLQRLKGNAITEREILHEKRKGLGGEIWLRDTAKYGKNRRLGFRRPLNNHLNLNQRVKSGMSNKKVQSVTKVK